MNIWKMRLAGFLGIISGLILSFIGFTGFSNPASHTFWNVVNLIVGILSVLINIWIGIDAANRKR